jgi:hypothetical protein
MPQGNHQPKGVEWMREIGVLGGRIGGKRRLVTMSPAERSLRATLAVRKRHGYPPWTDADCDAFRRGWAAGFEMAAGRK